MSYTQRCTYTPFCGRPSERLYVRSVGPDLRQPPVRPRRASTPSGSAQRPILASSSSSSSLVPSHPASQLCHSGREGGRERERERVAACPLNDAWGGDRLMQTQMASEHVFSHSLGLSVEASFLYYVCFLFSLSPPYGELFQTVLLS